MFGKLQQCVGKEVTIKFWQDGKIIFYQGVLDKLVNYKYIVMDKKNFLLFFAANGVIANIKFGNEIVYETQYDRNAYEPIVENIDEELEKREMANFDDDDEYRKMRYESSKEYFLKRGRELLVGGFADRWERFVTSNLPENYIIVKGVVDIVDKVLRGKSYYKALAETFDETFAYTLRDIEEVNNNVLRFFGVSVYEYTDYAVFMLHFSRTKKMEEKQNIKQLINGKQIYISLYK